MSATELLPCPFCGGEASAYPDGDMEGYVYRCWNTKRCEMSIFGHATDEEAAESWNTRSYPEGCTPTDIRVLRQANVDLAAESERLKGLAGALISKLDAVQPYLADLHAMAMVRGQIYRGPNYGVELQDLRAALASKEAP